MPYSITTKDGITINNIPDDVPANSQQLRDRVAKIRTGQDKADPEPSLGRTVGLTARNITEGAAGLAGTLVDPFVSAIGGAVRMATGSDYDPETMARIGMHVADALGLPKPETSSERISGALQKGLLGGLGGAGIANAVAKAFPVGSIVPIPDADSTPVTKETLFGLDSKMASEYIRQTASDWARLTTGFDAANCP